MRTHQWSILEFHESSRLTNPLLMIDLRPLCVTDPPLHLATTHLHSFDNTCLVRFHRHGIGTRQPFLALNFNFLLMAASIHYACPIPSLHHSSFACNAHIHIYLYHSLNVLPFPILSFPRSQTQAPLATYPLHCLISQILFHHLQPSCHSFILWLSSPIILLGLNLQCSLISPLY